MFSKIIISLFLFGIVAAGKAPICAVNEVFKSCGTACPATCENKDEFRICKEMCLQGCFCEEGYVRESENGPCVPANTCTNSIQCEENEEFSECATPCPSICGNDSIEPCPKICLRGCVCKKGFMRSSTDGPCIQEASCVATP